MNYFWDGFIKQATIASMVGKGVKSLGSTLTSLGAKGAGKAVTGFAPKAARGVGRVTNTVNQMSTAGKLGLGAVGGYGASKLMSGNQQQQPRMY